MNKFLHSEDVVLDEHPRAPIAPPRKDNLFARDILTALTMPKMRPSRTGSERFKQIKSKGFSC